jgi:hypothetical protein
MRPGLAHRGGLGAGVALAALLVGVVVGSGPSANATHAGFLDLGHVNGVAGVTTLFNTEASAGLDGTGLILQASGVDATFEQDGLFAVGRDEGDGVEAVGSDEGNGVFGHTGGIGSGVYGENRATGYGVAGRADDGTGVAGRADAGTGVLADSMNGIALRAVSSFGTALRVEGVAMFSRSGLATAGAGQTSQGVSGVPVTPDSMVLTTIQGINTTNIYVTSVVIRSRPTRVSFIIHFNQAVPAGTTLKIAWFVMN